MALGFLFFKPYFLVNDDVWELLISKGVGIAARPDEHLVFTNVLIGLLLKNLFTWAPGANWYGWYQIAAEFLSFWALLAGLLLRPSWAFKMLLFALSYFLVYLFYYQQLNFTIISALAFQGGLFLAAHLFEETEAPLPRVKILILGFTCILLSSVIRWESFVLSVLTAIPFMAGMAAPKNFAFPKRALLCLLVALLAAACLYDHFYYERNASWKEFVRFNHAASAAIDWRDLDYNPKTKPIFEHDGWTFNDFNLFKNWYFLDDKKYNPQTLEEISAHFPLGKKGYLPLLLRSFASADIYQNIFLCTIAFALFCASHRRKLLLGSVLWNVFLVLLLILFAKPNERLLLPLFNYLLALSLYHAEPPRPLQPPRFFPNQISPFLLGALVILLIPSLYRFNAIDSYNRNKENLLKMSVRELNPKDNQLYVVWGSTFPYESISALDNFEIFKTFHIFPLGSYQRSPLCLETLSRFQIKNLFRDLVDNPNAYLICDPYEGALYREYLLENYKMEIIPEKTFSSPLFKAFRIHSRRLPILQKKS